MATEPTSPSLAGREGQISLSSFLGDVRDAGIAFAAAFAFLGIVYYHYFLENLGVADASLSFPSQNLLVGAVAIFIHDQITVLVLAGLAVLAVSRKRFGKPLSWLSLGGNGRWLVMGLGFCVLYYYAMRDGRQAARDLREGRSLIGSVVLKADAKFTPPPKFDMANKNFLLVPVAESSDEYYLFYQPKICRAGGKCIYPNGYLYEIPKSDVKILFTSIPGFDP